MKYRNCMIAYNRGGPIAAGPHPDRTGWSRGYHATVGANYLEAKSASEADNKIQMLLDFHHAVVRDGVPLDQVHAAFWNIDEYRQCMARDVPPPEGARVDRDEDGAFV